MPDQPRLKETVVPLVAILAIFFVSFLFPPLGVVLGILSPTPLVLIYLQRGKQVGMAGLAVVFVLILVLIGPRQAVVFLAEYGIMAMILAETIRWRLTVEKIVLFSTLGATLLSGFLLYVVWANEGASITDIFEKQIHGMMKQSLETLKEMGKDAAEIETMRQFMEKISRPLAVSFPAILAVGSLFGAVANYSLVRFFWNRLYGAGIYAMDPLARWVVPDQMIWAFILSAGSLFFPDSGLGGLGVNVFIVVLAVYFVQGMGVLFHFFEARRVPVIFWALAVVFILAQPLFLGVMIGVGLFDLWIDFRKIRVPKEDPEFPED